MSWYILTRSGATERLALDTDKAKLIRMACAWTREAQAETIHLHRYFPRRNELRPLGVYRHGRLITAG